MTSNVAAVTPAVLGGRAGVVDSGWISVLGFTSGFLPPMLVQVYELVLFSSRTVRE